MNFKKYFSIFLTALLATGCLTRAPTTHELDRRAGMLLGRDGESTDALTKLRASSAIEKDSLMPLRIAPLIEKIWVYDQHLEDGSWLQGSWLFIEVEPARWLDEVDPGSAPLTTSPTQLQMKPVPKVKHSKKS